jgi:hypothetical protein
MESKNVIRHFEGEPPDTIELVLATRDLILKTVPNATESVVWNVLSYHDSSVGGRVKGAICQIEARNGKVVIGFIHGRSLPDPQGLLHGDRKSKRFVNVGSLDDLERTGLVDLLEAAGEFPSILSPGFDVKV